MLILLLLTGSYLFIPGKIEVTRSVTANANPVAVRRFLSEDSNWARWWPGSVSNADGAPVFESGGYRFKKSRVLYHAFEMLITHGKTTEKGILNIFSLGPDSVGIKWTATFNPVKNPFSKIRNNLKADKMARQMEDILSALQTYVSNVQHLYGINIRKEKVKVEFLVSTKKRFNGFPTTHNIYEMIGQVKKYISQSQVKEEDYPMVNISSRDSAHFEVQVAIPVDRYLAGNETFASKKMLKGGDILVTEITGGMNVVDTATKRMDQFVTDHEYIRIAIPFHSLVTDRLNEPDSNKWVTKLYVPILR